MTAPAGTERPVWTRYLPYLAVLGAAVVIQFLVTTEFPARLDNFFSDPVDSLGAWGQVNRRTGTHPLFTLVFNPLTSAVDGGIGLLETAL
ncbi:MAG: hypothetical protein OEY55_08675, partial [Acidimicrobiia bacterium]|nr:hypothetical protein [Acidimicrobiia bacterium]